MASITPSPAPSIEGMDYVPRTPGNWDKNLGDFTIDDGWHDMDLSGIIPAGVVGVVFKIGLLADAVNKYIYIVEAANLYSGMSVLSQYANVYNFQHGVVKAPTNRVFKYRANNAVSITQIRLAVLGWFISA